jgi:hypothetical protein
MGTQASSIDTTMRLLSRHALEIAELRAHLAMRNGGDGGRFIVGYQFIEEEWVERFPHNYIVITDEAEIAAVKAGWVSNPHAEINPAPGRICVIGSYN